MSLMFPALAVGLAQTVKHLPTMRETWVQSLGCEDLLEKEMAIHSSILAWKIPWTEEPGGLQPIGFQKSRTQLSNQTTTEKHESGIMADFLVIIFKTVIK